METTNPTELRKNLKSKLDLVSKDKATMIIHRAGLEDVVMVPLSEYNSWMETNYLLSTQANRDNLEKSIEEAKNGKVIKVDPDQLWK